MVEQAPAQRHPDEGKHQGCREEEEVEGSQHRAEQSRQTDEQRPVAPAGASLSGGWQPGDQQQHHAGQHGQAGDRRPMDEEANAHDRRDSEIRPRHATDGVVPGVVVAVVGDERDRVSESRGNVADEPDPAEAPCEDRERGGDEGGPPGVLPPEEGPAQAVDDQGQCAGQDRGRGDERRNGEEARRARGDRCVEILEPVVDERYACEIGDLWREVARVQALGNR